MGAQRKKILLLGGSDQQVIAIDAAKRLGYETIVCDYLPDSPGQHHADGFYQVSTTDKDAVLEVARQERIDGIIAYASDPAAPTAAYVAEELGLPGIPFSTAQAFCEKHLFRGFLRKHGFHVPQSCYVGVEDDPASVDLSGFRFPVIVKPTDSSGSKGVAVVRSDGAVPTALAAAHAYSRNGILIVEEFIERDHPHVIEAEVFVADGKVASWGLINSIRDASSNPLLPAAYSYPLQMPQRRQDIVRAEVSRLVEASGIRYGAFNIEMIINADDELFFLDAGPRNGGNRLPELMSMISGHDMVEASVRVAMGDVEGLDVALDGKTGGFWGLAVLHANASGRLEGVVYSSLAEKCLKEEFLQVQPGDSVRAFERCNDLLGLAIFRFNREEDCTRVMMGLDEHVHVRLGGIDNG